LQAAAQPPSIAGMVNPFAISWLWRGFKGKSVTFALLFASCLLGWPISGQVGRLLARMGVHWLYVLILPGLFFMWLAKRESRLIPDEAKRQLYARSLIAGSIVIAILVAWLRKE
jgi:ATP/ADP translocase